MTGCTQVSAGCDHCYALTLAHRRLKEFYLRRDPVNVDEKASADPFAVRLWPERAEEPLRWRTGRMVFVNSMSDLFHISVPALFIRGLFEVMLAADWHIYQILTKRPGRAASFIARNADLFPRGKVPPHIWIGTSVENQAVAYRVDQLRKANAEIRFLSCEPLLGPLRIMLRGIHWLIAGGESGRGHRAVDLDWVRGLREQCGAARVPFFFKQVGGYTPKAGGRLLDGREWSQYPEVAYERLPTT